MGADSKIEWTHHTFNPWWGCEKVSDGCKNCYAESFAKRTGHDVWGAGGERRTFGDKHWKEPRKWEGLALEAFERRRVFCASMADVFEDHPIATQERPRLWDLIERTPMLDWLLLTKRPENVQLFAPWGDRWPENVWLGTTVENNQAARKRLGWLRATKARVKFVSGEPLLEAPDWDATGIDWIIWGGESGPKARPCDLAWLRAGVALSRAAGAAPFVKQLGSMPSDGDYRLTRRLSDKGGDWSMWPEDLRVREFPAVRS